MLYSYNFFYSLLNDWWIGLQELIVSRIGINKLIYRVRYCVMQFLDMD